VEVGEVYDGKVVKIMNFGAFIEVPNGTQGLCHISEVDHKRIDRVEDYLSEGDHVKVKCIGTENGKVNFSIKALKEK
jgi:polyribonucleotide nucleotidyltransferase